MEYRTIDDYEKAFFGNAIDYDDCAIWQGGSGTRPIVHVPPVLRDSVPVKTTSPARMAWYLVKRYWPSRQILHSCINKRCINPEHLVEGIREARFSGV